MAHSATVEAGDSPAYQNKLLGLLGDRDPIEVMSKTPVFIRRVVAENAVRRFGGFLAVEIWESALIAKNEGGVTRPPSFLLHYDAGSFQKTLLEEFQAALSEVSVMQEHAKVTLAPAKTIAPSGRNPILEPFDRSLLLGIEIDPIYLSSIKKNLYPLVLLEFAKSFGVALKRLFFAYASAETRGDIPSDSGRGEQRWRNH